MNTKLLKFLKHLENIDFTGQVAFSNSRSQAKLILKRGEICSAHTTAQKKTYQHILQEDYQISRDTLGKALKEKGKKELEEFLFDMEVADPEKVMLEHNAAAIQKLLELSECRVSQMESEVECTISFKLEELLEVDVVEAESSSTNPVEVSDILESVVKAVTAVKNVALIDQETGMIISSALDEDEMLEIAGAFIPGVSDASQDLCLEAFNADLSSMAIETGKDLLLITPVGSNLPTSVLTLVDTSAISRENAIKVSDKTAAAVRRVI